ncbi:hypothetical protein GALMADRAFT_214338 [Galerina marginata CBS 339.88]|uniref:Uncharacterized protein n=1 Tax=Galerina marginata (strain CBS 339.88) TaxID=685588 RepID=A0A067SI37_GALM3|nr:hypothetical protein GALMADRAFT_214338 [Galerina marginata CBS 339.88]
MKSKHGIEAIQHLPFYVFVDFFRSLSCRWGNAWCGWISRCGAFRKQEGTVVGAVMIGPSEEEVAIGLVGGFTIEFGLVVASLLEARWLRKRRRGRGQHTIAVSVAAAKKDVPVKAIRKTTQPSIPGR